MQASVYTRERKHIGSIWSRVTCLALPLATAQSVEHRAFADSQSSASNDSDQKQAIQANK
jgi:hypothetical protein